VLIINWGTASNVIKKDVGKNYENAGDAYDEFINKFPKGG